MTDALDLAETLEGEGHLVLTLTKQIYITIDGDIRLYLSSISGNDEVRLSFIAPKEVTIVRSNARIEARGRDH